MLYREPTGNDAGEVHTTIRMDVALLVTLGLMLAGWFIGLMMGSGPCYEAREAASYYQKETIRLEHEQKEAEAYTLAGIGIVSDDIRRSADSLAAQTKRSGRTPYRLVLK